MSEGAISSPIPAVPYHQAGTARIREPATRDPQHLLLLAEEFIRQNIYNSISTPDIALTLGINTRALQRLFRRYRGATPIQVLASFRIAAAREMIISKQATAVRDIAARLQFTNPGRFSKLYRKIYSTTPSEEIRGQGNQR
jgi:transcriptional regulator GlxA family with amidase domain